VSTSTYGGRKALDDRLPVVYDQLRRLARSILGPKQKATLTATALVHEAYTRLAVGRKFPDVTEMAFKRIVAHVMRQVLCDAARRRRADKRGGSDAVHVSLPDELEDHQLSIDRIVLVNNFLDRLQAINPRQASVVELLFFGGLTIPEIAAELNISVSTAERDWRTARAFLSTEASDLTGKA
jgi:RNA polymerase sigma factor (TIGR02999 family)